MQRFRYLVLVLAAFVAAGAWGARPAAAQDQPTGIQVRGQGVVSARPDVALLTIGASVRRDTAGAAFNRAEELVGALTDTLKANGVAEQDIQTRQFSLNPETGRSSDTNPPPIVGWRATHTVTARLRDFNRIGQTIDAAVNALGTDATIQGISFAIENTDALAARARADALADARTKAEDYAARAGVRLGGIVAIQEVSSPTPTPERTLAAPAATGASAAVISPGELTITVIVDVIYAIGS